MENNQKSCEIILNGKASIVQSGLTVEELLRFMKWSRRGIAVELNGQIVTKEKFGTVTVQPGDCLEVVALVGGG